MKRIVTENMDFQKFGGGGSFDPQLAAGGETTRMAL